MQLDFSARELTIKLVYYGPALSGKTTNLQAIHQFVHPDGRGRLMTLDTKDDRTLFFDLLPLNFSAGHGLVVRVKLFTVPGQVIHNATRRLVLSGVDGVAFIADSRRSQTRANAQAFINLKTNLRDNTLDPEKIPVVIQFNKRDLPDVRPDAEIDILAQKGHEPVFKAIALRGQGVMETFLGLMEATWAQLDGDHGLEDRFDIDAAEMMHNLKKRLGLENEAPSSKNLAP